MYELNGIFECFAAMRILRPMCIFDVSSTSFVLSIRSTRQSKRLSILLLSHCMPEFSADFCEKKFNLFIEWVTEGSTVITPSVSGPILPLPKTSSSS